MTTKRGGKRPGAGRPAQGRKSRTMRLSDGEYIAVQQLLKQIRESAKNDKTV